MVQILIKNILKELENRCCNMYIWNLQLNKKCLSDVENYYEKCKKNIYN